MYKKKTSCETQQRIQRWVNKCMGTENYKREKQMGMGVGGGVHDLPHHILNIL